MIAKRIITVTKTHHRTKTSLVDTVGWAISPLTAPIQGCMITGLHRWALRVEESSGPACERRRTHTATPPAITASVSVSCLSLLNLPYSLYRVNFVQSLPLRGI